MMSVRLLKHTRLVVAELLSLYQAVDPTISIAQHQELLNEASYLELLKTNVKCLSNDISGKCRPFSALGRTGHPKGIPVSPFSRQIEAYLRLITAIHVDAHEKGVSFLSRGPLFSAIVQGPATAMYSVPWLLQYCGSQARLGFDIGRKVFHTSPPSRLCRTQGAARLMTQCEEAKREFESL